MKKTPIQTANQRHFRARNNNNNMGKKSADEAKENEEVRIDVELPLDVYLRLKKYAASKNMTMDECANFFMKREVERVERILGKKLC